MDIRIEGLHEEMLQKLATINHEPTAIGMVRTLIRDASIWHGIWPGTHRRDDLDGVRLGSASDTDTLTPAVQDATGDHTPSPR